MSERNLHELDSVVAESFDTRQDISREFFVRSNLGFRTRDTDCQILKSFSLIREEAEKFGLTMSFVDFGRTRNRRALVLELVGLSRVPEYCVVKRRNFHILNDSSEQEQ